jgi:Zn-dependent oligopeptidase
MADHMVTSFKKIYSFLWKQVKRLQKKEQKIYKEMLQNKPESVQLSDDGKLYPWDETFLKSHFRKNILGVDDLKISKRFTLKETLPRVLHLYEQFFAISFQRDNQYSWWSKDVSLYRVSDERTSELLGYVFFDLIERDGKNEQQKHITLVPGIRDDCNLPCLNVSVVVSDFQKSESGSVQLELHEIKSLIHEIGHAIHSCYGATDFVQQSGTQVARDFVELPAQIFEQWLEEPEVLRQLSLNHETGKSLSNKEIKNIVKAQKYVAVSQMLKQTFISLLMIELYKQEDKDPHEVAQELYKKVYPYLVCDPDYFIECNIDHFVSYGPSYYSYVWTKVLAEKLFKKIKKRGILERSVGKQFSKHILAPGGSGDYHSMIQAFKKSI